MSAVTGPKTYWAAGDHHYISADIDNGFYAFSRDYQSSNGLSIKPEVDEDGVYGISIKITVDGESAQAVLTTEQATTLAQWFAQRVNDWQD